MAKKTRKLSTLEQVAIAFDKLLLEIVKRGVQVIDHRTGRPKIADDGNPVYKPAGAAYLRVVASRMKDTKTAMTDNRSIREQIRDSIETHGLRYDGEGDQTDAQHDNSNGFSIGIHTDAHQARPLKPA